MKTLSSTDSIAPDDFFTGDKPVRTKKVVVAIGQTIAAREVMAFNTATQKWVTYAEGGANGTNVAGAIAAYDIDTTAAESNAQVYEEGSFNPALLVFSGTPTDAHKAAMFQNDGGINLQLPQV